MSDVHGQAVRTSEYTLKDREPIVPAPLRVWRIAGGPLFTNSQRKSHVIVLQVEGDSHGKLPKVIKANLLLGVAFGCRKRWKQERGEKRKNYDHDQKLQQTEGADGVSIS